MIQATRILLPVVDEDDLYLFINFEDKRDVKNNLKKLLLVSYFRWIHL